LSDLERSTGPAAFPWPPVAADPVLRAREYGQTLAAVVRGLPVRVVTAVPGWVIAFAEPTFAALLGYDDPRSVEGRNVFDLTHPDDRGLDETYADEVLRGVRAGYTLEKRFLRADGSAIWCAVSATVVRDAAGAPDFAFGVVQDISARKAAEAAAAAALARAEEGRRILEAVMAHVPEGITVADTPDVRIRMVSAYGAALTGRPMSALEEIPAQVHPEAWDIYHADGVTRAGAEELPLTRATVQGAVVKDEEWVLRRPDGACITVLCNAGPIRDADGRLVGGVIAWRDIDERKRAAEERERLLQEARAARDVAESALRARDALLARVTHDLRTPIAANYGYATLMRDGIPEPLPAVHHENVRRMVANQQHMMVLIDRLPEFARGSLHGEAGKESELAVVGVAELLGAVESLVAPQLREAGLDYGCSACESTLAVRADRTHAVQILVNLVGNAIKFTPPGGRVSLEAAAVNESVRITVTDTGVGIAPAQLEHIFEPFVQLQAAPSPRQAAVRARGFGLGLAISRELARGMGGSLTVESTPGHGSTFALTLRRG
jgi:PAS domain S-box-containing protein